jgi:hypothetical protein
MQCLIIVGKKEDTDEYISKFIQEKNIPAYFVYRFGDLLKISDVRLLKKNLSLAIPKNLYRLFVLPEHITIDAQNALLKTIEELGDETFIFFPTNTSETLLPTILSRSKVVWVSVFEKLESKLSDDVLAFVNATDKKEMFFYALQLSDKIGAKNGSQEIERILLELRSEIKKQALLDMNTPYLCSLIQIALKIQNLLPLLSENNVNKKFAFETVMLSEL